MVHAAKVMAATASAWTERASYLVHCDRLDTTYSFERRINSLLCEAPRNAASCACACMRVCVCVCVRMCVRVCFSLSHTHTHMCVCVCVSGPYETLIVSSASLKKRARESNGGDYRFLHFAAARAPPSLLATKCVLICAFLRYVCSAST